MRYVFYYPTKKIGGVQLLFSRIAQKLIIDNKNVSIINKDQPSYISNYLRENNLQFEDIIFHDKFYAKEDDIIILVLSLIGSYKKIIKAKSNTRFIFWDVHPNNLIENTAFSFFYKKNSNISPILKFIERNRLLSIRKFVEIATLNKGLVFMCNINYMRNYEYFNFNINPIFLTIPITYSFDKNYNNTNVSKSPSINIGWISRLDSDKLEALYMLTYDITEYNCKNKHNPLILHIIGDGVHEEQLRMNFKNNKNVLLTGKIEGSNLTNYILDNIDIGFSMGTAALEFAFRKKATILVPDTTENSFFKTTFKRYIWLYDSFGGDVSVSSYYHNKNKTKSFIEVLQEYQTNSKESNARCYDHANKYHNIDNIYSKFLNICTDSSLTHLEINKSKINSVFTLSYIFIILKKIYKSFF